MAVIDRLNVNQTPAFLKDGVFDISEYNNGAVYTDLSDALGQNGANIPPTIRKGGMNIKFIQGSTASANNRRYVQYRLMSQKFSINLNDWQNSNISIVENYKQLYYDIYSENLYKGPVQDVIGTLVNNVGHKAVINNNAVLNRCVKIPVTAGVIYYLPKLSDNNYNMLVGNYDGTVIDNDIWFVTHNNYYTGSGIIVNDNDNKYSFTPTRDGYLFVNLNLSPNFSLKVADKFYLTTSSTFEIPQEYCILDTLNTAEVKNNLINLNNKISDFDFIKSKLIKNMYESVNQINYNYLSANSEGDLINTYWTVADPLHTEGQLYKLKFNTAFISSGVGKFAIYRKIISEGVITAMTLIYEFTANYIENEYEIDVLDKNILLTEYDTVAYNPYSIGINKYKSTGGYQLVANGVLVNVWPNITLGFNFTVQYIEDIPSQEQIDNLEKNFYYLNNELPNETYSSWGIGWEVKNTSKPIQVASTVSYWCSISNNLNSNGILQKIKFSSAATSEYTLQFAIIRKVYQQDGVTFDTISIVSNHIVNVHVGDTIIDVSSMNIPIGINDTVGINYHDMAGNQNCYYSDSSDFSRLPWWAINFDGTNPRNAYKTNLYIGMDYEITQSSLKINNDVKKLDERVTTLEEKNEDLYSNLNIVMMGDSITYQGGDACNNANGWTKYFKDIIKSKTCVSYARSGATWSHTSNTKYNIIENTGSLSDDNVIYNQINRLIVAVNDNNNSQVAPDVILIAAGTNDAWYPSSRPNAISMTAAQVFGLSNGYILNQDVNTLTSIAQAVRYDCELIKSNFPNCQIILLSPLQSTKFSIERCFNVGNIIEECAAYLAAPCIRQDKETGLYRSQEATSYLFTIDGCHTSLLGAQNNGKVISTRFKALVRDKLI